MSTNYDHSGLINYLSSLDGCKKLSVDEARSATENELIRGHLGFVVWVAKRFSKRDPDRLLDCIQDGNIGLMAAAKAYSKTDKSLSFMTFARWTIFNHIRIGCWRADSTIRLPQGVFLLKKRIKAMADAGMQPEQIKQTLPESIRHGCEVEAIKFIVAHGTGTFVSEDEITDETAINIDEELAYIEAKIDRICTPKEKRFIEMSLGGYSYQEIGCTRRHGNAMTTDVIRKLSGKEDLTGHLLDWRMPAGKGLVNSR